MGELLVMSRHPLQCLQQRRSKHQALHSPGPVLQSLATRLDLGQVPTWHAQFLSHTVPGHECSEGDQSSAQTWAILQRKETQQNPLKEIKGPDCEAQRALRGSQLNAVEPTLERTALSRVNKQKEQTKSTLDGLGKTP